MHKITFKGQARTKAKASKVTECPEKQQRGFILILLMLVIFLFVMTPVGCATLLALLTPAGVAVAP